MLFTKFMSASYLLPVFTTCFIFGHKMVRCKENFLSASQLLQIWYGALARGPGHCLLNSCLPVIYFYFMTYFIF